MSLATRRRLTQVLGLLWVLDGLLQLQPYMWGPGFFADLIGMANMGLPHPLEVVDLHLTDLLAAHPLPWDLLFAGIQVALGLGLLTDGFRKPAIVASSAWGLGVWVVGEGVGALLMPGTSALNGAPGPVLLYVLTGALLWPGLRSEARSRLALSCWTLLWTGTALLELRAANHAPGVPAAEVGDGADQSLAPLGSLQRSVGHLLSGRGLAFAAAVGVLGAAVGVLVWFRPVRAAALVAGSVLTVVYWALGQGLGELTTGRSTDPGAGPLWLLLAAVVWSTTTGNSGRARTRLWQPGGWPSGSLKSTSSAPSRTWATRLRSS